MLVATWNVLHRVHAENWREVPIERFPREAERIAAITARVMATDADVVLLQEVSGDQLASLRAALAPAAQVLDFRYPRVPRPRVPPAPEATLADPSEHLVVIVRSRAPARVATAFAFDDDAGKGVLAVALAGDAVVASTHVSYGDKRTGQLARIAAAARAARVAAIAGDFNAERDVVAAELGADFAFAVPAEPALPTRPRAVPSGKSQTIDHVIVHGGRVVDGAVIDVGGVSDHNLVRARVVPPA